MKNILLVEPNYNSSYAPFGLLKISNYLKSKGYNVLFRKGKKIFDLRFDKIYITSLFTYYYKSTLETILFYKKHYPDSEILIGGIFASLMPEFIESVTKIKPYVGLISEVENCYADNSINNSDTSIAFTSRGCIRKCSFCVVPKIEGKLFNIENWENNIDTTKPKITFWDNNFFAKDFETIKKDIEKIKILISKGVKEFDFNQGLDARLFTKEIAELFKGLPIKPIRFAFDNMTEDGHVQKAIELAQKLKICLTQLWSGQNTPKVPSVYVLFNFKDSPQDFYYRLRETVKAGAMPYPMCYSPFNDLERKFVGEKWTLAQRNNVRELVGNRGQVSPKNQFEFEYFWGKNEKEFIDRISNKKVNKEIMDKNYRNMKIRNKNIYV